MKLLRKIASVPAGSWLTLAFTLLVVAMLASSFGLSQPSAWVPRVILSATLPLLLWQLALELRAPRAVRAGSSERRSRALAATGWISLLPVLAWLLGAAAGSAVFCAAWLRWHAKENWRSSLVVAGVLGFSLWLLFGFLLGVDLYRGAVRGLFG